MKDNIDHGQSFHLIYVRHLPPSTLNEGSTYLMNEATFGKLDEWYLRFEVQFRSHCM
jgi:hypothetical protein